MGAAVIALMGSYPILIERNIVKINHYHIFLKDLPASFNDYTIVHLTDLHFGALVSKTFIKQVVNTSNNLQPDLIACTGDFVHARNTTEEIDIVWPLLSKLTARDGVYSVLGNHDHWANTAKSLYWLEKSGQDIRHKSKTIKRGNDKITIGGAGDYWEDELKIDQVFSHAKDDGCKILLSHNPDSIDTNFKTQLSLVLSGHTHGGQVRIPFYGAPLLPVKNKWYSSGVIPTDKTILFISRGIGWAIFPIRFNCYPEIAVLHLKRKSGA